MYPDSCKYLTSALQESAKIIDTKASTFPYIAISIQSE